MTQAEKPASDDGGGLAPRLQADLARFDDLLAEVRREHERVARQLRDCHPQEAQTSDRPFAGAELRAAAGQTDEALRKPAPGVPLLGQAEPQAASQDLPGTVLAPPVSEMGAVAVSITSPGQGAVSRAPAEPAPAWESGASERGGAPVAGIACRDPTGSASSEVRELIGSAASTPSGGSQPHFTRGATSPGHKSVGKSLSKSFSKSFSRSFGNPLQNARESIKSMITTNAEVFDSQEEIEQRSFCYMFVSSPTFELIWSTVILLNTLTMALEAQYDGMDGSFRNNLGRSPSTEPASEVWPGADTAFVVADWMFGALFTLELLWRLAVFRKELFMDAWSWIDIVAVAFWYIEKLSESGLPMDPKFIRVSRLVKLLRFIRVIRFINAFEKLYLMVASIKSSFSALAWSSAVLFLVEMVFALLLNILMESFWDDTSNPMEDRQAIYQHFGTFSKSLLSMFEMLLGNWYTITRELVKVSEWYMIIGVGHQLCFGFAVIEVMTGVFLHETFQVASLDDGIMTNETKRAIKNNTEKMKIFFENADVNGDGYLDKDELRQVLQRSKVQEWLSGMGLDIPDVVTAFTVMDKDGDGQLSTEEFVEGALLLKGQARAIELAVLRSMLEEMKTRLDAARL